MKIEWWHDIYECAADVCSAAACAVETAMWGKYAKGNAPAILHVARDMGVNSQVAALAFAAVEEAKVKMRRQWEESRCDVAHVYSEADSMLRRRAIYLKNKDLVRERSRRFKRSERGKELDRLAHARQRERFNSTVKAMLNGIKNRPCMDCNGVFDPVCMDFDHRPDEEKLFTIAAWRKFSVRATTAKLHAEIAKCDVVCANCHRLRTHRRRDHRASVKAGEERAAAAVEAQLTFLIDEDKEAA